MNAWKITLPLAFATFLAAMFLGFESIAIVPGEGHGTDCGSAFSDKQGYNSDNTQAACTPILTERDSWATTLLFVSFGLFASSIFLNPNLITQFSKRSRPPMNQNYWPPMGPPGGYPQGPPPPGGYPQPPTQPPAA